MRKRRRRKRYIKAINNNNTVLFYPVRIFRSVLQLNWVRLYPSDRVQVILMLGLISSDFLFLFLV